MVISQYGRNARLRRGSGKEPRAHQYFLHETIHATLAKCDSSKSIPRSKASLIISRAEQGLRHSLVGNSVTVLHETISCRGETTHMSLDNAIKVQPTSPILHTKRIDPELVIPTPEALNIAEMPTIAEASGVSRTTLA